MDHDRSRCGVLFNTINDQCSITKKLYFVPVVIEGWWLCCYVSIAYLVFAASTVPLSRFVSEKTEALKSTKQQKKCEMPCINCIYLILSLVLQVVSNIQNFDAGGTFRCSIAAIKCTQESTIFVVVFFNHERFDTNTTCRRRPSPYPYPCGCNIDVEYCTCRSTIPVSPSCWCVCLVYSLHSPHFPPCDERDVEICS